MSQYPAVFDTSEIDGSNGFFLGGAPGRVGWRVSSAGDVNGDGFDDVMVGATVNDPATKNHGAAFVVFGSAAGFPALLDLASLNGSDGFKLAGANRQDYTGRALAAAGDVNGDGFADMLVAAPLADANGPNSGAVYVVFGTNAGYSPVLDLGTLDSAHGFTIVGPATYEGVGYAVSSAGDVNGDGFDDVVIGDVKGNAHGSTTGAAFVVFGSAAPGDIDLANLNGTNGFRINGEAKYDRTGTFVEAGGDINGDGFADFLIGRPKPPYGDNGGATYVVFGRGSGFAPVLELSSLNGTNGFKIDAGLVVPAGDINADGFTDMLVQQNLTLNVVFGTSSGLGPTIDLAHLDGTNGFRIDGPTLNDNGSKTGFALTYAAIGDYNGDGFDDIVVGAFDTVLGNRYYGRAWLIFGSASGFGAAFDVRQVDGNNGIEFTNHLQDHRLGFSLSAAGDMNGDGLADFIAGTPVPSPGDTSGDAVVLFGALPDESVTRTGTGIANTIHGGDFADTLSGLDGDDTLFGHRGNDVLVGGMGRDNLQGGEGDDHLDGGKNADTLDGGEGNDVLEGGRAADRITGGKGADILVYRNVADSTGSGHDTVSGFDFAGVDHFGLKVPVTAIDPMVATGALSAASFDADLAARLDAGALGAHHAVLFKPSTGDLAHQLFLVVDWNGVAGYQAGEDLVVQLLKEKNPAALDVSDFV